LQEAGERTIEETTFLRHIVEGQKPKLLETVRRFAVSKCPDSDSEAGTPTYTTVFADQFDVSFNISTDLAAQSSSGDDVKPSNDSDHSHEAVVLKQSTPGLQHISHFTEDAETLPSTGTGAKSGDDGVGHGNVDAKPAEDSTPATVVTVKRNRKRLWLLLGGVFVSVAALWVVVLLILRLSNGGTRPPAAAAAAAS
jgi:hypothetical protein